MFIIGNKVKISSNSPFYLELKGIIMVVIGIDFHNKIYAIERVDKIDDVNNYLVKEDEIISV